jgi:5-oxoprolinase (ATP-hydrolysing)
VRDRHPILRPGEAFALNNPYAGGTHLPDITVVMPVFGQGERPQFYVAARGHHADVGGISPGSMPPFSHLRRRTWPISRLSWPPARPGRRR